jgi:hypothetical protein
MNGDFPEFRGFRGFCDTAKGVAGAASSVVADALRPRPGGLGNPNEVRRRRGGTRLVVGDAVSLKRHLMHLYVMGWRHQWQGRGVRL